MKASLVFRVCQIHQLNNSHRKIRACSCVQCGGPLLLAIPGFAEYSLGYQKAKYTRFHWQNISNRNKILHIRLTKKLQEQNFHKFL